MFESPVANSLWTNTFCQIYDYMLTFEAERTLIWKERWTFTKFLFLVTRYLPFVDLSVPVVRRYFLKLPTLVSFMIVVQATH